MGTSPGCRRWAAQGSTRAAGAEGTAGRPPTAAWGSPWKGAAGQAERLLGLRAPGLGLVVDACPGAPAGGLGQRMEALSARGTESGSCGDRLGSGWFSVGAASRQALGLPHKLATPGRAPPCKTPEQGTGAAEPPAEPCASSGGRAPKAKKKAVPAKAGGKKKKKKKGSDDEAFEDSDDGDFEGQEVDYMSDGSR